MPTLRDAQDARSLLTRAAEQLSQITQVVEADEAVWALAFDGGGFELEWFKDGARLVLTATLGMPPAQGEVAALKLALAYNALWRDNGDLRLARDGDDGELLLIGELGADDGEQDSFNAALLHFEALRRWWTDAIARSGEGSAATPIDHALLLGRI